MNKKLESLALTGIPQTEVKLHDGRTIKLRAMLVRELKLLMMAMESGEWYDTLEQVIEQCIVTDGVDIKSLPTGDVENMFLQVHILSKGKHTLPLKYECEVEVTKTDDNGEEYEDICGGEMKVVVDLRDAKMSEATVSNQVKVNDSMTLNMRYPTGKEQQYFIVDDDAEMFNMCARCIESVSTEEETLIVGEDIEEEDLLSLFDNFTKETFESMSEFVNDTPMLSYPIAMTCPKCGAKHATKLKGLADFFE